MRTATYTIASGSKLDIEKTNVTAFATGENECLSSVTVGSYKISQVKNSGDGIVGAGFDYIHGQYQTSVSATYDVPYSSSAKTITVPEDYIAFRYYETINLSRLESVSVWSDLDPAPTLSSSVTLTATIATLYPCTIVSNNGSVSAYKTLYDDHGSKLEQGFPSGANVFEGNNIRLKATPNERYRFVEWQTTPSVEITNNNLLMPSEPLTITPIFERYIFDVSIGQSQFGTASANVYTGQAGNTITLTAYPNSGYQLLRWDSSPYVEITNNSFSMPSGDVTITPVFKEIPPNITAGYYNGSTYLPSVPMYYNGSNWIECEWGYYDGTNWLDADST